jgi:hypothetical protein
LGLLASGQAGLVTDLGILKEHNLVQSDAASVVDNSTNAYVFTTFADVLAGSLIASTLFPPFSAFQNLSPNSDGTHWALVKVFSTQSSLDSRYPSGSYVLLVHDISHSIQDVPFSLGPDGFPGPPHVNNYHQAQQIAAGADFSLLWSGFAGATNTDFAQLQIFDGGGGEVFASPDFAAAGALPGTVTNLVIPAGTLVENQTYQGLLTFFRFTTSNPNLYAGALSVAGFSSSTAFSLATFAAPVTPPPAVLGNPLLAAARGFQFAFSSVPNATYTVEESANLSAWRSLGAVTATEASTVFTDASPPTPGPRFYRVRSGN